MAVFVYINSGIRVQRNVGSVFANRVFAYGNGDIVQFEERGELSRKATVFIQRVTTSDRMESGKRGAVRDRVCESKVGSCVPQGLKG
jgi:hypothetical protein